MGATSLARITGIVYLLYFLTAIAGAQLTGGVTGVGAASGELIHEPMYRLGVAVGELSTLLYLVLVALLYRLLLPVDGTVAILALVFGAVGCAVTAVAAVFQIAAPVDPDLAVAFLSLNRQALHVALAFFAGFDVFIGVLVYRSRFLPRFIGALMVVSGGGWMITLAPTLPPPVAIPIALIGGLAEVALMVSLLAFGVRRTPTATSASSHVGV